MEKYCCNCYFGLDNWIFKDSDIELKLVETAELLYYMMASSAKISLAHSPARSANAILLLHAHQDGG